MMVAGSAGNAAANIIAHGKTSSATLLFYLLLSLTVLRNKHFIDFSPFSSAPRAVRGAQTSVKETQREGGRERERIGDNGLRARGVASRARAFIANFFRSFPAAFFVVSIASIAHFSKFRLLPFFFPSLSHLLLAHSFCIPCPLCQVFSFNYPSISRVFAIEIECEIECN